MFWRWARGSPIWAARSRPDHEICNQVIVGCAMAVLAEATRLATNAGIDAHRLPEALAGGFADSIRCNCSCRAWRQGFIRRRSAISPPCSRTWIRWSRWPATRRARADGGAGRAIVQNGEGGARGDADALEIYKLSAPGGLSEAVAAIEKPIAAAPRR